jgi:hypothetical protein
VHFESEMDALRLICARAALALSENPALALSKKLAALALRYIARYSARFDKKAKLAKI